LALEPGAAVKISGIRFHEYLHVGLWYLLELDGRACAWDGQPNPLIAPAQADMLRLLLAKEEKGNAKRSPENH
jgi:hypothetical protein